MTQGQVEVKKQRGFPRMVCDVCGKPATSAAQDIREVAPELGKKSFWVQYEATGHKSFGCDQHPAKSHTIVLSPEERAEAMIAQMEEQDEEG